MWTDDLKEIERPEDTPKKGLMGRVWDRLTRDDKDRNMTLSSDWARKRIKNTDPTKVAHDLMEIRGGVHNLLKIHGLPLKTQVNIALMGGMGAGCAGFLDFDSAGTFKRPIIQLDKAIYEDCEADAMMDVYCGVGLHEASHILHTREYFKRVRDGKMKGLRTMWEGLLEDERIEELAKKESPGFSPYIHATKRHLFEKQEFGNALAKWDEQPDRDKTLGLIFGGIRVPHLFEKKHKTWKTMSGVCIYEEMQEILDKMPKTEADVARLGGRLEEFWNKLIKDEKDLAGKSDEQVAEDMMDGEEGDPQQGGQGSGSEQESDSGDGKDGEEDADSEGQGGGGDSEEESENSDDDDDQDGGGSGKGDDEKENDEESEGGGSDDDSEESEEGEGQEGEGDNDEEEDGDEADEQKDEKESQEEPKQDKPIEPQAKEETVEEVKERRERQAKADEQDNAQAEVVRQLDKIANELRAAGSKNSSDVADAAQHSPQALKESQGKLEKFNVLKEELSEREGRFGLIDLKQMMDRMDSISAPLDHDESLAMAQAEEERLTFGQTWDCRTFNHGDTGGRKTLIVHPVANEKANKFYSEAKNDVKGHIQKMKNVFKFRLGTKVRQQTELVEGRLHRKMLALGNTTNRLFQRSYTQTEKGLAICLLLDNSGSMGSLGYGRRGKSDNALKCAVTIAEALKGVPGIELEVYSYTTCGPGGRDCFIKYLYGKNNPHIEGLGNYGVGGFGANYDHIAIQTATDLLIKNTENTNRMMIVMSDGQPAGAGYGGTTALRLTKQAVQSAEKKGVYTMQVAIDSVCSAEMFKHFVTFTDMSDLINKMRGLVTRVVKRTTQS